MTRFLFVVPPLAGHINPAAAVASELASRGHTVAWAGDAVALAGSAPVYDCSAPALVDRPPVLRGFAALKFLWEEILVPLAESMVPDVLEAVARFSPDVLVVDQQALAGALVAERLGLRWATSATTSSELLDPLASTPKVRQWLDSLLLSLRSRFGDPSATTDLRFSPFLVLAFTTEAMVGDSGVLPGVPISFVGPVRRPSSTERVAGDRPLVFVSLGTMNADVGQRFLEACVAALGERPRLRAVVVDPSGKVGSSGVPENVLIRPHVAQLEVLAGADAVICHGGHNTVCEALSEGVPLVVAPIRDDQPIIAEQVVRAGAGVRLRFDRADSHQIGAALDAVLGDAAYRAGAEAVRASFLAAGGAAAAADSLVRL